MKIKLTRQNIESALLYFIVGWILWGVIEMQILRYRINHLSTNPGEDILLKSLKNFKEFQDRGYKND